uniref:Uncharacterized protein n=1 Tax=Clastoptera arizonana TaxID=38151 RepID=A0A1B6DWX7_9HEMI
MWMTSSKMHAYFRMKSQSVSSAELIELYNQTENESSYIKNISTDVFDLNVPSTSTHSLNVAVPTSDILFSKTFYPIMPTINRLSPDWNVTVLNSETIIKQEETDVNRKTSKYCSSC